MKGKRGPRDLEKKSLPQLKRVLWDEFSKYIKQRDVDSHTGWGNCISCGKALQYGTTDAQAGHYIPKGKGGTHVLAFDEYNVNLQCSRCNLHEGGNFVEYEKNLRLKYGDDVVDELKEKGDINEISDHDRFWYIEKIGYYKQLNREMGV